MTSFSDDSKLVASLRKGDIDAFDQLFGIYAGRLYAFALKYLKSHEDAEELVQGIFLKVWEKRKSLKTETSFQSFLFTIAWNDICNVFRRRVSERKFNEKLCSEFSGQIPSMEEQVAFKSLLEQVEKLIDQLPEQQKYAFLKSRKYGLSSKEIAEELNLSPGTVDNYISAATKFIRSKLGSDNLALILFVNLWIV